MQNINFNVDVETNSITFNVKPPEHYTTSNYSTLAQELHRQNDKEWLFERDGLRLVNVGNSTVFLTIFERNHSNDSITILKSCHLQFSEPNRNTTTLIGLLEMIDEVPEGKEWINFKRAIVSSDRAFVKFSEEPIKGVIKQLVIENQALELSYKFDVDHEIISYAECVDKINEYNFLAESEPYQIKLRTFGRLKNIHLTWEDPDCLADECQTTMSHPNNYLTFNMYHALQKHLLNNPEDRKELLSFLSSTFDPTFSYSLTTQEGK